MFSGDELEEITGLFYLVKWNRLSYAECTWEEDTNFKACYQIEKGGVVL